MRMIDATARYRGYMYPKTWEMLVLSYRQNRSHRNQLPLMKLLTVSNCICCRTPTTVPYFNFHYGNKTLTCATGQSDKLEQDEALFRL